MANTCIVGIRIITASETDGKQLHDNLIRIQADAYLKDRGICIGNDCDLFDSVIYRDRDTILIFGRVKSNFGDGEAKEFTLWLQGQGEFKEFHMNYNESRKQYYGEYHYADKRLIKCYLPKPKYPEDDGERDFGITLETALKRHGVTEEIPMP